MAEKTYAELLKDPRWQKKRLEILERDNWTCQICDRKDKTLHVHHKYYVSGKSPWEYDETALVTLCDTCHKEEEEGLKILPGQLSATMRLCGCTAHHFAELLHICTHCGLETPFVLDAFAEMVKRTHHAGHFCGEQSANGNPLPFKQWE